MGNPNETNTIEARSLSGDELLEKAKRQAEEMFLVLIECNQNKLLFLFC